jgi:choice-of-anchor B domain-containing protein
MKKLFTVFLVLFYFVSNAQQNHALNMKMLSHWNDTTLSHCDGDQIWNNLTGWHDSIKKREYLIAGSCDSIYFFDITDPTKMIKCDVKDGAAHNAVNRDYDTYKHYLYCVSDRDNGNGTLQIFDLQYLPDSVHKVYDNNSFSVTSHTLFIEAKYERLYLCGNLHKYGGQAGSSMLILSIASPENPTYLGELAVASECHYTHEVYVRNDTAYCSCATQGLFIYDVKNPTTPKNIGSITTYPYNGYNHSSWLDSSGKYLMFTDEVPTGLPIKIFDITDLQNAKLVSTFNSNTGATPHNAIWKGRYAWTSSYEDGVFGYDLLNPSQPKVAAYFDTYMKNPIGVYSTYYHGCWGVYPFLPSGYIIASDISEGLFVLGIDSIHLGINDLSSSTIQASIFPNPVFDVLHLNIPSKQKTGASLQITDMLGKIILQQNINLSIGENEFLFDELKNQFSGIYIIQIRSNDGFWSSKFLKQ